MNKRKKKALLTLLMVAVLGVVGGTFAYFMSEDTFTNIFSTKPYKMEVKETFQSPTDWTPGTTTSKTVIAKNTGQVDAAVRVSIESQAWQDSLGQPLNLAVDGEDAAIINFADDLAEKWTSSVEGGKTYYYYKTKLAPGQSTSSFIKSVTFNPDVEIDSAHNCETDDTNHTETCTTTTSGYAGGTYTLDIKVETVQFDQYKNAWGTTVTIN